MRIVYICEYNLKAKQMLRQFEQGQQTGYGLSHEGGLNAFEFLNIEAKGAEQYGRGTSWGEGRGLGITNGT